MLVSNIYVHLLSITFIILCVGLRYVHASKLLFNHDAFLSTLSKQQRSHLMPT